MSDVAQCILDLKPLLEKYKKDGVSDELMDTLDSFVEEVKKGTVNDDRIEAFMNEFTSNAMIQMHAQAGNEVFLVKMRNTLVGYGNKALEAIADTLSPRHSKKNITIGEGHVKAVTDVRKAEVHHSVDQVLERHKMRLDKLPKDFGWEVARAMKGLDTPNAAAKEVAQVLRGHYDSIRASRRASGQFIEDLPDYIPHHLEAALVASDLDGFADILQYADRKRFAAHIEDIDNPTPEEMASIADYVMNSVRSNKARDFDIDFDPGASRRKLNFFHSDPALGAEMEIKMLQRYSGRDFMDMVMSDLDHNIQEVVMAERFGPKWRSNIQSLAEVAKQQAIRSGVPVDEINPLVNHINRVSSAVKESMQPPVNQTMASIDNAILSYQQSRLLGRAVRYALLDAVGVGFRTSMFKSGGYLGLMKNIIAQQSDESLKEVLDGMNFVHAYSQGLMSDRFIGADPYKVGATAQGVAGKVEAGTAKMAHGLFKWTGLNYTTDALVRANTAVYLKEFANMAGVSWNDLRGHHPVLHRRMQEFGISQSTWEAATKSEFVQDGFLNVNKIQDPTAKQAVSAYMMHEASIAVTRPDLYTQAMIGGLKGEKGTLRHTVLSSILQFQAFQVQYMRGMVLRTIREDGVTGITRLVAPAVLTGGAIYQAERLSAGKEPLSWDNPILIANAVERSGVMAWAGVMTSGAVERSVVGGGTTFDLDRMLGPTAGQLTQGLDIAWQSIGADTAAQRSRMMDKQMRFVVNSIPWRNHILWAGIINDMLDDFSEAHAPQLARERARRERVISRAKFGSF